MNSRKRKTWSLTDILIGAKIYTKCVRFQLNTNVELSDYAYNNFLDLHIPYVKITDIAINNPLLWSISEAELIRRANDKLVKLVKKS